MPAFDPAFRAVLLACLLSLAGRAEAGGPGAETGGNTHFRYVLDTASRTDSAPRPAPPPPTKQQLQNDRTAAGVGEIIVGSLILLIGMVANKVSSWPKCEPPELTPSGFVIDYGPYPCTDDGPSESGQAMGLGMAVAGGMMVADGVRRVVVPLR